MKETVIVYLLVAVIGLYSLATSVMRIFTAQLPDDKKKAILSSLSATIFLAICGAAIYITQNDFFPQIAVLLTSLVLLSLNEVFFWTIRKAS